MRRSLPGQVHRGQGKRGSPGREGRASGAPTAVRDLEVHGSAKRSGEIAIASARMAVLNYTPLTAGESNLLAAERFADSGTGTLKTC